MHSPRKYSDLAVLLAYSIVTVALTYPLAWNIGSALPGIPPDTYLYIWNLEWVRRAIFELGVNPFWTSTIYYPTGVSLYYHSLILGSDLLALPFQFAFGSVRAYMVMTLGLIIVSGYAAYLLAFDLTRNRAAAFFAGFVFTFSPYRFAHLTFSHFDLQPLLWLPLIALAVKKLLDHPALSRFILSLVLLFWVSITDWYYALYAFIWLGLYILYRWIRTRSWRPLAMGLLLVLGTFVLLAPLLVPMFEEKDQYPLTFRGAEEADKFSADLASYVTPDSGQPVWGRWFEALDSRFLGGIAERTLFLGYIVLALVLFALVNRRGCELYFWAITGIVFLLLSLGPYLHIGGSSQLGPNGARIPLPYLLLLQIPFLDNLLAIARSISRFGMMVSFSTGMIAAMGLNELIKRLGAQKGYAVVFAACAVAACEFLAVPLPMTNAQPPAALAMLAADSSNFGVMDLPPDYRTGAEAMYYWTIEGKPTTNGYVSRLFPFPLVNGIPTMRSAIDAPEQDDILIEPRPTPAQVLNFFNVRYLALHKRTAGQDITDSARGWITRTFGPLSPVADDNALSLYRVPPASAPPLIAAFGHGWYEPEPSGVGVVMRWMLNDGQLLLYANGPRRVTLDVDCYALGRARRSRFYLNGKQVLGALIPSDTVRHLTIENLKLTSGMNELVVHILEPAELPAAFGLKPDPRPFTIGCGQLSIVESPAPISK